MRAEREVGDSGLRICDRFPPGAVIRHAFLPFSALPSP
jgi:hypothetical protein